MIIYTYHWTFNCRLNWRSFSLQKLHLRGLTKTCSQSRSELAMNSVFSLLWNIWMQREFVSIVNADFNEKLVQGFVSSWSTSTVVCVGILTQLTFEGIWIGSKRSPTTVIERRLGRSVPKSVESGTTSQEGIIKNNKGLCWRCFYLQKITFLTEPYHIWLGLTLKINRRQTAAKGIKHAFWLS